MESRLKSKVGEVFVFIALAQELKAVKAHEIKVIVKRCAHEFVEKSGKIRFVITESFGDISERNRFFEMIVYIVQYINYCRYVSAFRNYHCVFVVLGEQSENQRNIPLDYYLRRA